MKRVKPGAVLRWSQVAHSALFIPILLLGSFFDIFRITLQAGQSIRVPGQFGPLGDYINTTIGFWIVAQIICIWRLSSVSIIIYAWFGSWLLLFSIAGLYSGSIFAHSLDNVTAIGQQILDILKLNYKIGDISIEVGTAWVFFVIVSASMVGMAIWMFVEKLKLVKALSTETAPQTNSTQSIATLDMSTDW